MADEEILVSLERTAIHEAGHAASLFADGISIQSYYVRTAGDAFSGPIVGTMNPQWPMANLRFLAAGFSAERLIELGLSDWPEHAEADRVKFEEVLRSLSNAGWTDVAVGWTHENALRRTRELVDEQHDAINRLVACLRADPTRPIGDIYRQMAGNELGIAWNEPPPAAPTRRVEDAPFPASPTDV
jgi:hypothetical protein